MVRLNAFLYDLSAGLLKINRVIGWNSIIAFEWFLPLFSIAGREDVALCHVFEWPIVQPRVRRLDFTHEQHNEGVKEGYPL